MFFIPVYYLYLSKYIVVSSTISTSDDVRVV